MSKGKKHIYVPRESLDAMLYKLYTEADNTNKKKLWTIGGAIARLGTVNVKGKDGKDIEMFTVPETWYNWIKDLHDMPF